MKDFYSTVEVAQEFGVTDESVRNWITEGKLVALRPAGPGGRYRMPAAALAVFRRASQGVPAEIRRRGTGASSRMSLDDFYRDRIAPVTVATGLGADELIRQMAHDSDLVLRYPSFASDYSQYVSALSESVRGVDAAHTFGA